MSRLTFTLSLSVVFASAVTFADDLPPGSYKDSCQCTVGYSNGQAVLTCHCSDGNCLKGGIVGLGQGGGWNSCPVSSKYVSDCKYFGNHNGQLVCESGQ